MSDSPQGFIISLCTNRNMNRKEGEGVTNNTICKTQKHSLNQGRNMFVKSQYLNMDAGPLSYCGEKEVMQC